MRIEADNNRAKKPKGTPLKGPNSKPSSKPKTITKRPKKKG